MVELPQQTWFRSVRPLYQYAPPRFVPRRTRFNPGDIEVMYFAPQMLLARLEAGDVFGRSGRVVATGLGERHVVVEYAIDLGRAPAVVDVRPPQLGTLGTSVQEMTGDWETYPWDSSLAPTQYLATAVFGRADAPMGLLAPSARDPLQDNLILFAKRLPPASIAFVATHISN